ncbi:hypothetical protein C0J52_13128 [Blattella germanica]|nr:hypothetical protein C0J52_13128 [Blattella germanica]
MLPSTGYFKLINCPFYDCALCERPYCHFRHVKKDPNELHGISKEDKNQGLFNYDIPEEESFSIIVSEVLKKEPEKQQETLNVSVTPAEITESARVESQEVDDVDCAVHRSEVGTQRCQPKVYLPPAGIPDYKPTPIAELKKRHILVPCSSLPTFKKSKVQIKSSSKDLTNDTNCHTGTTVIHDSEEKLTSWRATSASHVDVRDTNLSDSVTKSTTGATNDLSPTQESFPSTSNANVKTGQYFRKNSSGGDMNYEVTGNLESDQIITESNSEVYEKLKPNEVVKIDDLSLSDEFNELEKIFSDNYVENLNAQEELEKPNVGSSKQWFGETLQDSKLQNSQDTVSGAKVEPKYAFEDSKWTNEETQTIQLTNRKDKDIENKLTKTREREDVTSPPVKVVNKKHKSIKTNKECKYSNLKDKLKKVSSYRTKSEKLASTGSDMSKNNKDSSLSNLGSRTNKRRHTVFGIDNCKHKNLKNDECSGSIEENKSTEHPGIASPKSDCKKSAIEEPTQYLMSDSGTDEETINEECFRIFQEYEHHALSPRGRKLNMEEPMKKDRKRIAHDHPSQSMPAPPNPIEIMHSRIAKHKVEHDNNGTGFNSVDLTNCNSISSGDNSNASAVAPLPCGNSISIPKRVRIAHVPNVSMLLNEKLRIQMIIQQRKLNSTTQYQSFENHNLKPDNCPIKAQTVQKGARRVAHRSSGPAMHQPKLYGRLGGKVPANVRQKYLKHLISEYAKLHLIDEEANTKAAMEEALIYEHSSSRSIYSSKMFNKINCIRKQAKHQTESLPAPGRSKAHASWSIVRRHKTSCDSFYAQMLSFMLTEELLCSNGFPRPHPKEKGMAIVRLQQPVSSTPKKRVRTCSRCGCSYRINESGFQVTEEQCTYHWGKLYQKNVKGQWDHSYTCCGGNCETVGCVVSSCHVSDDLDPSNLRGFVKTLPTESDPPSGDYGVYALDCEMCYTTGGLELTRVTVIDRELDTVYESLVKPKNPIIDYNTRFSGITEGDLKHVVTTVLDVQAALLALFNEKTILIGHSLESDLMVLKLIHSAVVDTSVVFPHKMGPPKKRALKTLCWEHLNKIIQESESGHDSAEDATACMELMKWKVGHGDSR